MNENYLILSSSEYLKSGHASFGTNAEQLPHLQNFKYFIKKKKFLHHLRETVFGKFPNLITH